MVEKLASSEIAESRERFEKWARPRFSPECFRLSKLGHYFDGGVQGEWEVWQAAERDTRERCAQLCDEILLPIEDWAGTKKEFGQKLCAALAERIRGKE